MSSWVLGLAELSALSLILSWVASSQWSVLVSWVPQYTLQFIMHDCQWWEVSMWSIAILVLPSVLYQVQWWMHLHGYHVSAMQRPVLWQKRRLSPLSLVTGSTYILPKINGWDIMSCEEDAIVTLSAVRTWICHWMICSQWHSVRDCTTCPWYPHLWHLYGH